MASDTSSSGETEPAKPARPGLKASIGAALPSERLGDHVTILSGVGQNIAGLGIYVVASFATNILISHRLGAPGLGVVTLATQLAFVGGAATRFGMDMAAVRRVAVDVGKGEPGRARSVMLRAVAIAAVASLAVAALILAGAGQLARQLHGPRAVFVAAALALPFVALCQVYLGGTRGLKIMRHTLYVYWAGQPVLWLVLTVAGWLVSRSTRSAGFTVLTYAVSWALATLAAWFLWERETTGLAPLPAEPGEVRALLRYGVPRAPASLLAQLLFWTDYFVFAHYAKSARLVAELGHYAAAVRLGQALVLFLIAVNYMFSPYVADLNARGERDKLNALYQALTRWMVAGTLPLLLLLAIAPGSALQLFGHGFQSSSTALRILLIGQIVNVATGSVGFILVMVGRTGWDLTVYLLSFVMDAAVAFALAPHLHANGAAVAQMTALVVSNGLGLVLVWRFVHIQPFNRHYLRLAIPAVAGAAVMVAAHLTLHRAAWPVDLAGTGVAGTLVYGLVLAAAGLTPTERGAIRSVAIAVLGTRR